jgi:inward rectifier potassium channel
MMLWGESQFTKAYQVKVNRKGFKNKYFSDLYHYVLSITWLQFFIINTSLYLLLNVFFASLYCLFPDSILNAKPHSFWEAFIFSFQTSATIGYGHLLPATTYANIVVIFDTLSGIFFVALTTGLAFAKFSRPTARVLFSDNCVIHKFNGKETLMFRIVNGRDSHISDASIDAIVVMSEVSPEGIKMQRLYDLKLIRNKTPLFFLSWTVMHIIDEESPFNNLSLENYKERNLRIVISLKGIDDWSAQTVHTNEIYQYESIVKNKKFIDMVENHPDRSITINLKKLNDLEDVK